MSTFQPDWSPTEMLLHAAAPHLEPTNEPGPAMSEEQRAQHDVLAIKREVAQLYDRQSAALAGQIEQQRNAIANELRSDIPSALTEAVSTAHQALLAARQQSAIARQALELHTRARPRPGITTADDIDAWTETDALLSRKLQTRERLVFDAELAYTEAKGRVDQAHKAANQRKLLAAQATYDRLDVEVRARIATMDAELFNYREEAGRRLKAARDLIDRYTWYEGNQG